MIQPHHSYFWYRALVKDVRGVICTKEGDIPGNNAIHAMKAIENMNKNTWKCQLMGLALHAINWETGQLEDDPLINWTRHGGQQEALRNMDFVEDDDDPLGWNPYDYGSPIMEADPKEGGDTSHSVRSFQASDIGTVMKSAEPFKSTIIKGVET